MMKIRRRCCCFVRDMTTSSHTRQSVRPGAEDTFVLQMAAAPCDFLASPCIKALRTLSRRPNCYELSTIVHVTSESVASRKVLVGSYQ